jgi:hypothetical protein
VSTLIYLVLAALAGGLVGGIRAERLPYAGAACALAALIVSIAVSLPLNDKGPHALEVAVLPAATGAFIGALAMRAALIRTAATTE